MVKQRSFKPQNRVQVSGGPPFYILSIYAYQGEKRMNKKLLEEHPLPWSLDTSGNYIDEYCCPVNWVRAATGKTIAFFDDEEMAREFIKKFSEY